MAIGVLKEIKDVEAAAENLRLEALAKSREMVKEATEQASRELDSADREAQNIISSVVSQKEGEAQKQADDILKSSQKDCEKIRQVPQDRIDRAVNLVIERIVKLHGDS